MRKSNILDLLFPDYGCVVCMYTCVPSACGNQKRASDPLKLALQMVVSYHIGAGNQTRQSVLSTVEPSLYPWKLNMKRGNGAGLTRGAH